LLLKSFFTFIERIFPKLITAIETDDCSYIQGWGPPEDLHGEKSYGPGLKRLVFETA